MNTFLDLRTHVIPTDGTIPTAPASYIDPLTNEPWHYVMESWMKPEIVCTNRLRNLVSYILDAPGDNAYAQLDENDQEVEMNRAICTRAISLHAVVDVTQASYLQYNPDHVDDMSIDEMNTLLMPSMERAHWIKTIERSDWTSIIPLFLVGWRERDERWPEGNVRMLDTDTDLTYLQDLDRDAHLIRLIHVADEVD